MLLISKFLLKYRNHPSVEHVFSALRPAVVGLLLAATLLLMNGENFSSMSENPWRFCLSIFLFVFAFIAQKVYRLGPILIILLCGFAGIILGL
jgi:chromate transporter